MNQKTIGSILIIIGILLIFLTWQNRSAEDFYINEYIAKEGSCFLDDGTCLHNNRNNTFHILQFGLGFSLIIFGLYIGFLDKTQEFLEKHQIKISKALSDAKKEEIKKDKIKAFLAGFDERDAKIIEAIYEQDGILQSTLRYRTDMSKSTLSESLKSLEERGFVKRKVSGKTNQVFLVKKF